LANEVFMSLTEPTHLPSNEQSRVLLVDDDAAVLRLLKSMLTKANYRVTTCQAADEALRLLSQGAEFDCMVTDAMMPVMNGYQLVSALKNNASYRDIPVLMLTRKSDRSDVKKAVEAGVNDYILKPIDEFLLLDKINNCLKVKKPNAREVLLHGPEGKTDVTIEARITAVRESGFTTRFPIPLTDGAPIRFGTPIFKEMGIPVPMMKQTRCEFLPQRDVATFADIPYEIDFSFVGVEEIHLKKIRAWLQKQEILRKK
jgi:CheY-like chemotaxis protein